MDKKALYESVLLQASGLIEPGLKPVSLLANIAALLKQNIPYLSWCGFYLKNEDHSLYLGPFQGLVATTHIPFEKGVCGKAAREEKTVIVEDVHAFPGHIACDAGSQSEIVVPLLQHGVLFGVLDLDSYDHAAFDTIDQYYLERLMQQVVESLS